jgi:hypothetical protein
MNYAIRDLIELGGWSFKTINLQKGILAKGRDIFEKSVFLK